MANRLPEGFTQPFTFQMNGVWLPDVHPLHVGAKNFVECKNQHPTSTGYETVDGYSKINTTPTATPVNSHHFKKDGETHVIAKINSSGTYSLYDNTTAIPSQGDFNSTPLYTVGSGLGSFANGPQGTMFYADGQYSLVTGGDEMRLESFAVGDNLDTLRDFTENINNDLTSKVAGVGGGGNDSNTVLLLSMDGADASTTFTDTGATTHTVTATGDAQIDIDYYKFGGASGMFDGNGDYLSIPDHADFNYSTGALTIDGWVNFSTISSGQKCLYYQGLNDSYVALIQDNESNLLRFIVLSSGTELLNMASTWSPLANIWYHWAVIRGWGGNANDWALTVNGAIVGSTATASITMPDVAAVVTIGTSSLLGITDYGDTAHGFSVSGNATLSASAYKFGNASLYLDGTGDYIAASNSSDWDIFNQTNATVSAWVKHTDHVGTEIYIEQYQNATNFWSLYHVHGTGIRFRVLVAGVEKVILTGGEIADTDWHHIVVVKVGDDYGLYKDGTQIAFQNASVTADFTGNLYMGLHGDTTGYFDGNIDETEINHSNYFSAAPVVGLSDTISVPTGHHASPDSNVKLLLYFDIPYFDGWMDEYRVSKGVTRWSSTFSPSQKAYYDKTDFFYVGSPLKLNGIKIYIETANTETSTMSGSVSVGSAWSTLTLTDNTSSGGISLFQTGTVTFSYNEDAKPIYINGAVLYVYRFAISAGGASVYKVTASAPLQPIRDVWNKSPRTCISFQVYKNASTNYSDYTFQVEAKDSSESSVYAAEIGGMVAADYFEIFFDDRTMGINFSMLSSLVNAVDAQITGVLYWDGGSYTSVGYFVDKTLDAAADSSFAKSGVLWWTPPTDDQEKPQEKFGIKGYGYKITIDGIGLTANTSIDLVTGITAPMDMVGYDRVGVYNGRVMLIDGNRVDYSQTDTPWVFNGVDSSDGGRLSLYFGDENAITATGNIYNRFGSNLVEAWVVTKDNATLVLTGSQPYAQYDNAFTIKTVSEIIGCHAPETMRSAVVEISEGLNMSILTWLDYSGPIIFNGAEPVKLTGVENFFDQNKSVKINYSYMDKSVAYVDTISNEINFLFPTNANTANSKWIAYNLKEKKWFEKVPPNYPVTATSVTDTNGVRYNYGFISSGYMMRLDNGATWDSTAISQNFLTGYFSPPMIDEFGFWSRSELNALKLVSEKITEDQDVTVTVYNDGQASSNTLTIALNPASGVVSKNDIGRGNLFENASFYQVNFAASNSSGKWTPLAWGYRARLIRED